MNSLKAILRKLIRKNQKTSSEYFIFNFALRVLLICLSLRFINLNNTIKIADYFLDQRQLKDHYSASCSYASIS
jgi:hypothetical protein